MRFRSALLSICAASTLTVAFASVSEAGADSWLEGRTEHFEIYSDGREKDVREIGQWAERFRTLMDGLIDRPELAEPRVPVRIFAFRHRKDLEALFPDARDRKVVFFPRLLSLDFGVDLDAWPRGATEQLQFDLYDYYAERLAPWTPDWLRYGRDWLWAATSFDGTGADVGRMSWQLQIVRKSGTPEIVRIISPDDHVRYEKLVFSAESSLFVGYLMFGRPDGAAELKRLDRLLREGVPSADAVSTVWGPDLQDQLEAYVHRGSFPALHADLKESYRDPSVTISTMSAAAVFALRADLLVSTKQREDARPLIEQALSLDSANEIALRANGWLEWVDGRREAARPWFERAASRVDASFGAHYLLATCVPLPPHARPADVDRERDELQQTLTLDSRFAPAMASEALLLARHGSDPMLATQLITRAALVEPTEPVYLVAGATVKKQIGDLDAARDLARRANDLAVVIPIAQTANIVCWEGALDGFAKEVTPTCERAVALAPNSGNIRDSRGFARALVGDLSGAAEDFTYAIANASDEDDEFRQTRTAWVASLKAGKNPFDAATLEHLVETTSVFR